jgi:4'-phosphopantetheinyl transferase
VLIRYPDGISLLTVTERERAMAFRRPSDTETFVAAHVLVRVCAARALGTTPDRLTLVQRCDECGGPHGRPSIQEAPDLAVSLSHTGGHVAACAGRGPLGIDVEVLSGRLDDGLMRRVMAPGEVALIEAAADPSLAFLLLWVRKEALIKVGEATLDTLHEIDLSADMSRWRDLYLTSWAERGVVGAVVAPEPWHRD